MLAALLLAVADPRADLAAAQAERAMAERRAAALDARAATARARVAGMTAQDAMLSVRLRDAARAEAQARNRAVQVEGRRRALALRIADAQAPLAALIAVQARLARRPAAAALLVPNTIDDAARLHALIGATMSLLQTKTHAMRSDLAAMDALDREAARLLRLAESARRTLDQRRLALDRAQARERAIDDDATVGADDERTLALAALRRTERLDALVGRADGEATLNARLATLPIPLARASAPRGNPPHAAPLYRLPAAGRVVEGSNEGGESFRARGLTLATDPGAPATAPGAGRIVYAGAFRGYGDVVILDHGHGWTSLVAGLAKTSVAAGRTVAGGDAIGRTGPSLQIELRHRGRPVDVARMAQMLAG